MSSMCIIPARGGSKRLPGKNTSPFFGHPLLAYSIAAAQRSGLFDDILVSTDDPQIGRIAEHYGAEYLDRPPELATDKAGLIEVTEHALQVLRERGRTPDTVCQLMPNCPLRRSEDVVRHFQAFQSGNRNFQISVVPYRGVYPHWALTANQDGHGAFMFGKEFLVQSQQLADAVCPTGAIWWVRTAEFLAQRKFYGEPFFLERLDWINGIDIDHREELELAEIMVRGIRDRDGVSPLEPVSREPFDSARA